MYCATVQQWTKPVVSSIVRLTVLTVPAKVFAAHSVTSAENHYLSLDLGSLSPLQCLFSAVCPLYISDREERLWLYQKFDFVNLFIKKLEERPAL